MSWPANPYNGQQVQISGIIYEYDDANGTWNKVGGADTINIIADTVQTPELTVTGNAYLGPPANVHIEGGSDAYVLTTDGAGNLRWEPQGTSTPHGSAGEVQYNDGGFGSSATFTFNSTTDTLTSPNIAGNLVTGAQPNITSVGTLTSVSVTGNANIGVVNAVRLGGNLTTNAQPNITSVGVLASLSTTGNVTANGIDANRLKAPSTTLNTQVLTNTSGNISGSSNLRFDGSNLSITGNVNATGTITTTALIGNIVTANQSNITQVGTLGNLSIGGNLTMGGNISALSVTGNYSGNIIGNIASPGSNTQLVFNNQGNLGAASTLTYTVDVVPHLSTTGNISGRNVNAGNRLTANFVSGNLLTNAQPNITQVGTLANLSVNGNVDITNSMLTVINTSIKGHLIPDGQELYDLGSDTHRWRTLYLSGNTSRTGTASVSSTTDGNVLLQSPNGSTLSNTFTSTATGVAPFTVSSDIMVANLNSQFLQGYAPQSGNLPSTIVLRNSFNNFEANIITARLHGTANLAGQVTTAAQPNITSVGTLTSLTVTGNLEVNNIQLNNTLLAEEFFGGGGGLTNINGANVSQVPFANYASHAGQTDFADDAGTAQYAVQITGNNQPNITSVGILSSLEVTSNVTAGNITVTTNMFAANFIGGNISGNISGCIASPGSNTEVLFNREGNLGTSTALTFNFLTNTLTTTGEFYSNDAHLGNAVTANYFIGSGNNLSNIRGSNVNGQVAFAATANSVSGSNVSGQVTSALTAGTITATAQPNISSVGTLVDINATTPTLTIDNPFNLNQTWNNADVAFTAIKLNVTDIASNVNSVLLDLQIGGSSKFRVEKNGNTYLGNLTAGNVEGTLITASQPYITSVGTLGVLSVTGNVRSGNATLGNLVTANYFSGDGSLLTGLPKNDGLSNGTSNIKILEDSNINFSLSGTENVFTISTTLANLKANLNVGNANLGGLAEAAFFSGDGGLLSNITAANLVGTVPLADSATIAGTVTTRDQPNITSVGTLANLSLVATASPSLGNNISSIFYTGTLRTNAQPNITSVGRLSSLSVGNTTDHTDFGNGTISASGIVTAAEFNISGAGYFSGNGYGITYIAGGNVFGQVGSALSADSTQTVSASAQPNITSVGTLASLSVAGAINAGDTTIIGNLLVQGTTITANATSLNVKDPLIEQGGNPGGLPLSSNDGKDRGQILHYYSGVARDAFMGWDNSNAEFAFASISTVTSEVMTFSEFGNIRASYLIGNGVQVTNDVTASSFVGNVFVNGTSNITIDPSANIRFTANGKANTVSIFGGATVATSGLFANGYISAVGNIRTSNHMYAGANLLVNGNITGYNLVWGGTLSSTGTTRVGTDLSVVGNSDSNNFNTTGTGAYYGNAFGLFNIPGANVSEVPLATHITATAQPNISSVGLLTSLSVVGNIDAGNLRTAGQVTSTGNITGGNILFGTGVVTGSGNVIGGNILFGSGLVTGTGNINTGNLSVTGAANFSVTNFNSLATFTTSTDIIAAGTISQAATITLNFATGAVFYYTSTSTANFTVNVQNVPETVNRTLVIPIIVEQPAGLTAGIPKPFKINDTTQTVKWLFNTEPSGSPGTTDKFIFTLIRTSGGSWVVLGQAASYG
jgi:hypothetical protein